MQRVSDDKGAARARLSHDAPAMSFSDSLDEELSPNIPDGLMVVLTLWAPIGNLRKTRTVLAKRIGDLVAADNEIQVTETIEGNEVGIRVTRYERDSGKKVVAVVANRYSSPDILVNAWETLEDRIVDKAGKCRLLSQRPIWLALLNDYRLADVETYRQAFEKLSLQHPFERILIVGGNRSVDDLFVLGAVRRAT
jgi:hypothetical protein